jgi:tol-pal system protein YbgF
MLGEEQTRPFCGPEGGQEVRISALLFVCFLVSSCVSTSDFENMQRDLNDLKRGSVVVRQDISSLKEQTTGTVKEDSFTAVRESQADMNSRVSEISSGLQELRGRFEENKFYFEKTLKDSLAERELLKAQIASLETQVRTMKDKLLLLEEKEKSRKQAEEQKPEQEKAAPAGIGEKEEKPMPEGPDSTPSKQNGEVDRTKAYETAYQAFKDKKFKEARERFGSFIKDYPQNELTDNAQFWIAEAYYAEKDYEGAVLAYETLIKKYAGSEKTSGALLKQGFAFVEIGDVKTGKAILSRLVEKFPDSNEAGLAKKKIAEIEKKPGRKR